ncbi:MAG: hypothetical protein BM485_14660 [Desulfobulbaceae bacterium DB1]|nr:MAG: hypothetical protein BM485_14660 [Desulfobulbaceae bacterium DB1]
MEEKDDFSLRIIWRGNEDKPFYRAHYASQSLSDTLKDQPFWGNGVISVEEFGRVMRIIETNGLQIEHEVVNGNNFGYFVEIRMGARTDYCFLGFSRKTLELLERMLAAFNPENRAPLRSIIDRIAINLP